MKKSKKVKTVYVCHECGCHQPRWMGRCPDCGTWDSLHEEKPAAGRSAASGVRSPKAILIHEIQSTEEERHRSGIHELDRVLGGGLVHGSTVLLAGEPGIGKSTLLLEAAQRFSLGGRRFLYVTGEESASQVKLRADRLGSSGDSLYLLAECDVDSIEEQILTVKPDLVAIDSVQTLHWREIPSTAGSLIQVRESTARIMGLARNLGFPLVLVGHVTKEGSIAGPRALEHLVDAVVSFEGERTQGLRILRAFKNRFGSTQEVGLFDMRGSGLEEVSNPSELFLQGRRPGAPGAATAAVMEGNRALLLEIQALVTEKSYGAPARKVSGLEPGRLSMLAAVLEKQLGVVLGDRDIYANVVGGVRITNPCADLALAAALLSSLNNRPISSHSLFIGEVGLLGEVRQIPGLHRSLEEAARLGFRTAYLPQGRNESSPKGIEVIEVATLAGLADLL